MTGPDGGLRDKKTSKGIVAETKRICRVIKDVDFTRLFNRKIIRNEYLEIHCDRKGIKAGSRRKYLYSLKMFCNFLIADNIELKHIPVDQIIAMKGLFSNWRDSYRKPERDRFQERQEEDLQMLVTPDQVEQYLSSASAKLAIQLLNCCNEQRKVYSQKEFISIRDHLFMVIHFGTAHRSGVTANLELSEFQNAELNDGHYVIKVRHHKTFSYYGHALIVLEAHQFKWLSSFTHIIREQRSPKVQNVFVSWSGKAMVSGDISNRLHTLWVKAGIFDNRQIPKKLSCNGIRKSASTGVRENSIKDKQIVADLMAHDVHTADQHYNPRNRRITALKASNVLNAHFGSGLPSSTTTTQSSPKKLWTVDEVQILQSVYGENILSNNVDLVSVREKRHLLANLGHLSDRQIYDKLKSLLRYSPMKRTRRSISFQPVSYFQILQGCFIITLLERF